jgi:DNA-directed RNA polymerase II subunit RPB2
VRPGDDLRLARFVTELRPQISELGMEPAWGPEWRTVLSKEFLPHVGDDDAQKLYWVMRWTRELVECKFGMRPASDRDHLAEKRVTTGGALLETKFADELRCYWSKCAAHMDEHEGSDVGMAMAVNSTFITDAIHRMMRTGVVRGTMVGFVVAAERGKSAMALACNPRASHQFMPTGGRHFLPRAVHGSHYGFICPAQTPSGESIGYTKTPAQSCEYTIRGDEPMWVAAIQALVEPWRPGDDRVLLNGRILGRPRHAGVLEALLETRKKDPHASVFREPGEVHVDISAGRWVRPVWRLPDARPMDLEALPSLASLIAQGLVEYLDPGSDAVVATSFEAVTPECTHVELDASLLLGESAGHIPFAHHTPAPRISFQAGMAHQAIDVPVDAGSVREARMFASWETTHVRRLSRDTHARSSPCRTASA